MTYLQTFKLTHDPDFRARVQVAAYLVGRDIANDGADQGDARHLLARQAHRLDEPAVDRLAWACATNPTIAAAEATTVGSAPDGDLAFVVASVWDAAAGQPVTPE